MFDTIMSVSLVCAALYIAVMTIECHGLRRELVEAKRTYEHARKTWAGYSKP